MELCVRIQELRSGGAGSALWRSAAQAVSTILHNLILFRGE